jgi:hypothetical protein
MRRLASAVALAALAATGCTFTDGRGFARASGQLTASFAGLDPDAGRTTADGWFKTDTSFELSFTALTLQVREVQLTAAAASGSASGSSCTFDPADPPAGCTLCHSGHCHCGDELKTYENLEAELCGGSGGAAASTLLAFPLDADLELLQPPPALALETCGAACDLGRGEIDAVTVVLDRMTLRATLRDCSVADRLGGAELDVTVNWDLAGATLTSTLAEPALLDRDQPYEVRIVVELPVAAGLLDGITWDQLEHTDTALTINAATNPGAGETLTQNLGLTALGVTVTRAGD